MRGSLISRVKSRITLARDPIAYARDLGVTVGAGCRFLGLRPGTFGSEPYLVSMGDHVTITGGVQFVTHDGGVWVLRDKYPDIDVFGAIHLGSNVFVGYGSIILPGVKIGSSVVIGAGSVVVRDIPDGSVAVGSPARVVNTVANYEEKSLQTATHVRRLPASEKRNFLLRRFDLDRARE